MALCSRSSQDPLLKELLDKGINLVLPPRDDLLAGDLLIAEGHRARRASWQSVLGVDPDRVAIERKPFKSFDLKVSDKLSVGVAASLTGSVLKRFGFTNAKMSAALTSAHCDRVALKLLAPALSQLADTDAVLDQLRDAGAVPHPSYDEFELYLVRGVWRARGLTLELYDSNNQRIVASAAVADAVSGTLNVAMKSDTNGRLTFAADAAVIFGVETGRLSFHAGMVTETAPRIALKLREADATASFIETEDDSAFVDFDDDEPL